VAPIYRVMQDFSQSIVPLSVVGMFLNYCGNHIVSYAHQILKKKIFYPSHRVVSIQYLQNGEFLTHVLRRQFTVKMVEKTGVVKFSKKEESVSFRSKAVVVSNGAR